MTTLCQESTSAESWRQSLTRNFGANSSRDNNTAKLNLAIPQHHCSSRSLITALILANCCFHQISSTPCPGVRIKHRVNPVFTCSFHQAAVLQPVEIRANLDPNHTPKQIPISYALLSSPFPIMNSSISNSSVLLKSLLYSRPPSPSPPPKRDPKPRAQQPPAHQTRTRRKTETDKLNGARRRSLATRGCLGA
jgi:hypothetical protein